MKAFGRTQMLIAFFCLLDPARAIAGAIWPEHSIASIYLGESCFQATQKLNSMSFSLVIQEGELRSFDDAVAEKVGSLPAHSGYYPAIRSVFEKGAEQVDFRCDSTFEATIVTSVVYTFSGENLFRDQVVASLNGRFGKPDWSGAGGPRDQYEQIWIADHRATDTQRFGDVQKSTLDSSFARYEDNAFDHTQVVEINEGADVFKSQGSEWVREMNKALRKRPPSVSY